MSIFSFSMNGVAPVCLILLLGFCLRKWGILDKNSASKLNSLAYHVLIPCNLFMSLYKSELTEVFDLTVLLTCLLGHAAVVVILCFTVPRFIRKGSERGEFIQGVFRGNTAILGIPLITNLYGESATSLLAVPFSVMLVFYNITAPIILTAFAGGKHTNASDIVRKTLTNPFLIGTILGVVFSVFHIPLPTVVESTVNTIGSSGSVLALLALGAASDFSDFRTSGKLAFLAVALRLILIPCILLPVGILLGMRNEVLAVLVCFFCTPTAVGSCVLAENITGDGRLARQILILSTVFSMLTMFATLAVLRGCGVM